MKMKPSYGISDRIGRWGMLLLAWLLASLVTSQASASASTSSAAAITAALEAFPEELFGQPIEDIRFEGNRRVESEAMMLELDSHVGELVQKRTLANDLRRLWDLKFFEDVSVSGELTTRGVRLIYKVKERPSIRKIVIEGNKAVKLDDINEQLDLEKNQVLDLGRVKDNVEKVRKLYIENGFFLAEMTYELRPVPDEPGKIDIAIVITEASEVVVRQIDFVGNSAFSDTELRKHISTRVGGYLSVIAKRAGGVFNKEAFAQDYAFLRNYYGDNGYLNASPKDPEMSLSADRRFVYLTIPIDEGPQFRIGEIRAQEVLGPGEEELYDEAILAEAIDPTLGVGDVASVGKIQKIREAIERRYKDSGYAYVNVVPNQRIDREKRLLFMTMEVQKGPLVYIERIEISGNEKTADKVIRREMQLAEGDLYSETGKEQTEYRVLRLGYFSQVNLSTTRGSADDKIIVNVELVEQLTGTFQIGAGFSTIERFVIQGQISYDNFLGRGATVQLSLQWSYLRRLFNFNYYTRYFLNSKWNFALSVFNSQNVFPSFQRESTGFRISWGYPIWRDLTLFVGYNFERVRVGFGNLNAVGSLFTQNAAVRVPPNALVDNLFTNGYTSAVTARVQYDTRDNFLFPTQGMFHQLRGEFASKYFGSQNRYNRYVLDSRFYFPVIRTEKAFRAWLVFKTRLQVGYIHNGEKRGVPIVERFFPGGIYGDGGIRGFRYSSLGPRIQIAQSSDPTGALGPYRIGGNLLTALNLELEFMIVPPANIKGVVFFDVGNAFNTESQYCDEPKPDLLRKSDPCAPWRFRDLRYSLGLGFRWQSPIGPLRFEWGFPLDRLRPTSFDLYGEEPFVFEFSIGNSF